MDNEKFMEEFKLFREQIYNKINEFEEILHGLHNENSDAIDDIIMSMLEKDGGSNV